MSDLEEPSTNVRLLSRREETRGSGSAFRGAGAPQGSQTTSITRPSAPAVVSFDRRELGAILQLYGRKVAAGEWRDYTLDFTPQRAIFSIFRRTSEAPLYRVEKDPALARKQGAYSIVAASGMILRRGNDLARVIGVLEKTVRLVSS